MTYAIGHIFIIKAIVAAAVIPNNVRSIEPDVAVRVFSGY